MPPKYKSQATEVELQPETIPPQEMSRIVAPVLSLVQKYFENPKVQAEYEKWKERRKSNASN